MDLPRGLHEALDGGAIVVCWLPSEGLDAARRAARGLSERVCAAEASRRPRQRLYVSRSATAGMAALALSAQGPVGIDVECIGPLPEAHVLDEVLHAAERIGAPTTGQAFCELWTRKEAVLKALGIGLALAPRRLACGGRDLAWKTVGNPWGESVPLRSLEAPDGHAAAVAHLAGGRAVAEFRFDAGEASPAPQ